MEETESYQRAKKRVEAIKGFYGHLFTYLIINAALFLINIVTDRGHFWFYWPMIGWGIGVVAHGVSVFGIGGLFGADWEERKIKEYMEKESRKGV